MVASPSATPSDFRLVFEATPGLYLVLDPDLTITAVNDTYCAATMTKRSEIVGRSLFDVFPDNPDDPSADGVSNLRASLQRVLKFRRPDAMAIQKYDIKRPDSEGGGFEERYWSPLNSPVLDDGGEVAYIIHRVEDITQIVHLKAEGEARGRLAQEQQEIIDQLRAANEALARQIDQNKRLEAENSAASGDQYRLAEILNKTLESMANPVIVVDAAGTVVHLNAAAKRLVGTPAALADLKDRVRAYRPDGATPLPDHDGAISRALHGEATFNLELLLRCEGKGGDLRFLASGHPIRNPDGTIAGAVAVFHDITAMRSAEIQLRHALKMEAIGTLAGGVAHELNNLLQPIIMMTELVVTELPSESRHRDQLDRVIDAGAKAAEIVQRILAFGRADEVSHTVLDVAFVAREAIAFIRTMLPSSITFHVDIEDTVGMVRGDKTQLTQVLINLATNARDAIGAHVGAIWISLSSANIEASAVGTLKPGRYALLTVRDTGAGMDKATVDRIFEPFFTTKGVGKGTGLGLSVTHGIVTGHGGAIQVNSTPGRGATFSVYLPLKGEEIPAALAS